MLVFSLGVVAPLAFSVSGYSSSRGSSCDSSRGFSASSHSVSSYSFVVFSYSASVPCRGVVPTCAPS
jgi:hypothetical protein